MSIQINNPHFAPPPSGFIPNFGQGHSSPKRACFIDYFPHVKENYKGYIKQSIFDVKMKKAIKQSIESAGKLSARFRELPELSNRIKIPSDLIVKSEFSMDQTGLDKTTRESTIKGYYEGIRTDLLHRVWGEEWRTPSEMNMSRDMYAQSNAYFKSAGMDVGIGLVSFGVGKGIGKLSKNLHLRSKTIQKGIAKIESSSIKGKTYNRSLSLEVNVAKNSNWGRSISFEGLGKKADASIGLFQGDIFGSTKDVWKHNVTEIYNHNFGKSDDFEPFDSFDYSNYGMNKKVNTGLDVATDFVPLVGIAKTITNIGFNTILGFQTRAAANRMKVVEEQSNQAERNFNQKLKQTIYDDVNALSYEDIKHLIEVVGLTELTK